MKLSYIGKPSELDWEAVKAQSWHFGERVVELTMREWSSSKSRQYEKWYWSVCLKLASEHTGYTPDELHEINKARHLKRTATDPMTGKELTIVRGTSDKDFTMKEQFEFYEAVQRDYSEFLGLVIPDPNESITPAP